MPCKRRKGRCTNNTMCLKVTQIHKTTIPWELIGPIFLTIHIHSHVMCMDTPIPSTSTWVPSSYRSGKIVMYKKINLHMDRERERIKEKGVCGVREWSVKRQVKRQIEGLEIIRQSVDVLSINRILCVLCVDVYIFRILELGKQANRGKTTATAFDLFFPFLSLAHFPFLAHYTTQVSNKW